MPRKLRVEYRTEDSFRREYAQNISKGGIFIPTRRQLEVRDLVEVELVLAFRDLSVVLPGEVVHCIPPEMAETGAQPGVAIQFTIDGGEVRSKLEAMAGRVTATADERLQGTGRRIAPRFRARVAARVQVDGTWVEGHTRNVSRSGMLVFLPGAPPPVGQKVSVRIDHPGIEGGMKIGGVVTRHVEAGGARCVGIEFRVPEARLPEVAEFVERVRTVEHSRRLGGINGPIADLGIRSVLAMFGSCAPAGMLTLTRGEEQGYITIDHGQLRAQLGASIGREAIQVLLSWSDGSFEFEAQPDESLVNGESIPVAELVGDVAVPRPERPEKSAAARGASREPAGGDDDELVLVDLDAFELGDTGLELPADGDGDDEDREPAPARDRARAAPSRTGALDANEDSMRDLVFEGFGNDDEPAPDAGTPITPEARLVLAGGAPGDRGDLGKVAEALLDLAAVGMTVAKAVEIIPEPDLEIYAALRNLIDEGFVALA